MHCFPDIVPAAINSEPSTALMLVIVIVLFTVAFVCSAVITYKLKQKSFRRKEQDNNKQANSGDPEDDSGGA